jgi:hypothetical protein
MLRIRLVSDLHLDIKHNEWDNPPEHADTIVYSGDEMAPATLAIFDLRRRWPHHEINYVKACSTSTRATGNTDVTQNKLNNAIRWIQKG